MQKLLLIEVRNCIKRLEFKLMLLCLFIISIGTFWVDCYNYYGRNLCNLRSAYELGIIQSLNFKIILQLLIVILPIISCVIYSDSYYKDYKSGIYKTILTKVEKMNYFLSKAVVNFFITFLVFFIPLVINQILYCIAFPCKGYFNNYGLPYYDIGYTNFNSLYVLDLLRIKSPLLYNLTYILNISLFAGTFALLVFSFQLYYKRNGFMIPVGVFIIYIMLSILIDDFIQINNISILKYLQPNVVGKFRIIPIMQLVLNTISILLILNKTRKEIDL